MVSNNEDRKNAESKYESIPLINRMSYLLTVLSSKEEEADVQQQAAILFRRIITSNFDDTYNKLTVNQQNDVKNQLLACVTSNSEHFVRKKVSDCISELSRRLADDSGKNNWPEVLKFMFDSISTNDATVKDISLHIFCQYPGIFGDQQDHYKDVIHRMLAQCLQPTETKVVRYSASCALSAFLMENCENQSLIRHFQDLIPLFLKACEESTDEAEDRVLKSLVEICEEAPKIVKPHIGITLMLCHKIIADTNGEDAIRHLALEAVLTLSETAPVMIRKQKSFIHAIIPVILQLLVDLDDDEASLIEWSQTDDVEDDTDSNPAIGENAIDRLACALGGKCILPLIMQNVPSMLQSADWKHRHGGLMVLSSVGEGCTKHMEEILPEIVQSVVPFLRDEHPRVRYAACNALGQMCTDFAPTMQKNFHQQLVPALYSTMDDVKNPRVQAHAGAALVNFVEDCPKNTLLPYLEPLCTKLEQVLTQQIHELMQKGTKLVLEQVTTTIAAVADTAGERFIDFYDKFMPTLKYIMQNASSPEYRLLRGKTIECISLMGLAVGSEKFEPDAQEIMDELLRTQADIESWEEDDPQISYMISAWARMCKLLGSKFVQYLPVVMGPLMKAASIRPEVTMLDTQDVDAVDEDDGWEFIKLGDQQSFGIKTAGLEEKATACQMLVCYARELKEAFADYVEGVVKLMVPLLKFYFHDGVRSSAAESLPFLLQCAVLRGDEYVASIWNFIAPNLLQAIADEPVSDTQSIAMESLARCIEIRGLGCFTMEQYQELAQILHKMLEEHFERSQKRLDQRNDEDYDEQLEEKLMQEDESDVYILSKISDILHSLFGTHQSELFPFFETLLPHYTKLLAPERPWSDRQWSLCVFDDVIEHTGAASIKYSEFFVRPMLQYLSDESPEVRQAASYGIGVMAMSASDTYANVIREALAQLRDVIIGPYGYLNGSREVMQENIPPLENCISAVGKILKYAPGLLGDQRSALLSDWLSWLPVVEDKEEATHVYSFICDLIESNDAAILGDNNVNLSAVICLIADAVYGSSFSECPEVAKRMINICKSVQTNASDVWMSAINALPSPKQISMSVFMQSNNETSTTS